MNQDKLNVHSYESMGSVDGPGLRFVVFTYDCPLRCSFCHNPDTWCHSKTNYVDVNEIAQKVISVKAFMNGGAVTISGGEPLLQIDALISLFKILKKEGVHTCIDTSGFVDINDKLAELVSLTDLFLVDIKHIDDEAHKALTGVSNEKTLKFINYLNEHNRPIWVRHVLVPGITTKKEDLIKLREYLDTLNNVEKIEILPYHTLGIHKYEELGLEYQLKGVPSPTTEEINLAKEILRVK